jgi:methionyl-tRNA formyltransferase
LASQRLRVGFAGTPGFAAAALTAIADAGYTIPLCLTQPDRPKGRGLALAPSPVKDVARARGLPLWQPATLRDPASVANLVAIPLDVLVVAAYGLILPPAILAWPRHGCINIHASLLPRWRGAAPIPRAIEAGDPRSGITIMQMDAGLDTGPIISAAEVPIAPRETAGSLHDKLAREGAAEIVEALTRLERDGRLDAMAQPAEGVTYAAKIGREDARLDWTRSADALDAQVRAFDPVPGAWTSFGGEPVKLWQAQASGGGAGIPGTVKAITSGGLVVACGSGSLRIGELQPAGGRRMSAAAFAAGRGIVPGTRLGVE